MSLQLKDIYDTFDNVRRDGQSLDQLEALLIHSDDFVELLKSINESSGNEDDISRTFLNCIDHTSGEIKICGIKIIDNAYVQRGSVYKIFKNKALYFCPPENEYANINNGPFQDISFSLPTEGTGWKKTYGSLYPKPVFEDDKKFKKSDNQKKHSLKRKIELGR